MAINTTFSATVSDSAATSYITVENADTYMATRVETVATTTWDALDSDDKEKYLMLATTDIDTMRFIGKKYNGLETDETDSDFQRLAFPRSTQESEYIPDEVEIATCVQALYILANSGLHDETAKVANQGIESVVVPMAITMNVKKSTYSRICPEAKVLLAGWISRAFDLVEG